MNALQAIFQGIWDRIKNEPVLALGIVQAGLALAVGFGLGFTGEQVGLVVAFTATVLSFIARNRVTPV